MVCMWFVNGNFDVFPFKPMQTPNTNLANATIFHWLALGVTWGGRGAAFELVLGLRGFLGTNMLESAPRNVADMSHAQQELYHIMVE